MANLLLASTLFWGVPTLDADEMNLSVPAEAAEYCHLKFPAIREDTLSWERPLLDGPSNTIDFYGPCDHDPLGPDEIRAQRRAHFRSDYGHGD